MKRRALLQQHARRWLRRLIPARRRALPCVIENRRIYVLPTGLGLFLAVLVLMMTLGALNYANNPALLLALLVAGAGLASALAAHLQLSGLVVSAVHAAPVAAGQPLQVQIQLEQTTGRARDGLQLHFDDAPPATVTMAPAGLQATCTLPTQRRGLLPLPPLSLSTTQPLGLVLAFSRLLPHAQCLVHPCAEPNGPPLPIPPAPAGNRSSHLGEDEQLRDYRAGDSRARIAWKASAHRQGLLVRQPTSGGPAPVSLDWQQLGSLGHEARISRLTHWVQLAAHSGVPWQLQLPGQAALGPGSGHDHLQACLRALALMPDGR